MSSFCHCLAPGSASQGAVALLNGPGSAIARRPPSSTTSEICGRQQHKPRPVYKGVRAHCPCSALALKYRARATLAEARNRARATKTISHPQQSGRDRTEAMGEETAASEKRANREGSPARSVSHSSQGRKRSPVPPKQQ